VVLRLLCLVGVALPKEPSHDPGAPRKTFVGVGLAVFSAHRLVFHGADAVALIVGLRALKLRAGRSDAESAVLYAFLVSFTRISFASNGDTLI